VPGATIQLTGGSSARAARADSYRSSRLASRPQPPPPPAIPSSTDPPQAGPTAADEHPTLAAQVYQNIAALHKIQSLHAKMAVLDGGDAATSPSKRGVDLPPLLEPAAATDDEVEEPDGVREARRIKVERRRRLPSDLRAPRTRRPEVSTAQAMESMKLSVGTLLAHAGFEGQSAPSPASPKLC